MPSKWWIRLVQCLVPMIAFISILKVNHSIFVQIKELWTYGRITQQKDTNQNIWVKPIGLWQGCRYVHDDIFYDCWSWGFRFICIVFHYYIEKYSIYKQNLCFSPCRIYFVRGSWIHASWSSSLFLRWRWRFRKSE
jgi:hypothetical protein